jgi:hypothetical protein
MHMHMMIEIRVLTKGLSKKKFTHAVLLLICRLLFTSFFSQTAERVCKRGSMFEWLYFLNHFDPLLKVIY